VQRRPAEGWHRRLVADESRRALRCRGAARAVEVELARARDAAQPRAARRGSGAGRPCERAAMTILTDALGTIRGDPTGRS
jgi:hypothetical protein